MVCIKCKTLLECNHTNQNRGYKMKDFSYTDQGLFTAFIPNTKAAETAA
jgi:hypothetical protein